MVSQYTRVRTGKITIYRIYKFLVLILALTNIINKLIMITSSRDQSHDQTYQIYNRPHISTSIDTRFLIHSKDRKTNTKVCPSKQNISSLEYSILMNHPQLDSETLTARLFHCTADDENCLFKKQQSKRQSRVIFRALCPNIYIQKLRIIYFLLLTQSYHPLYNTSHLTAPTCPQNPTSTHPSTYTSQNHTHLAENLDTPSNSFRTALQILRYKYYSDSSIDAIKRKYLAQFFQFLQYDKQQLLMNSKNGIQTKQNIVIAIMNKYPIIDEIFIDMLISYIKEQCLSIDDQQSIDDNYNIKIFLDSMLGLQNQFISNWEFILDGINVVIGTDMFYLDYDRFSYFREIVQSLKEKQEGDCHNGLDVSKVGGFDEEVFKKLDLSYIDDLNDLLSNCSDGNSQLETDTQIFGNQSQHEKLPKSKLNIRRVQSLSYYHPINILNSDLSHKKSEATLHMKKHQNRTLDSTQNKQLQRHVVPIHNNQTATNKDISHISVIKQVNEVKIEPQNNLKLNPKSSDNPESIKHSPVQSTNTVRPIQAMKMPNKQQIEQKQEVQPEKKDTTKNQWAFGQETKNTSIYYNKTEDKKDHIKTQRNAISLQNDTQVLDEKGQYIINPTIQSQRKNVEIQREQATLKNIKQINFKNVQSNTSLGNIVIQLPGQQSTTLIQKDVENREDQSKQKMENKNWQQEQPKVNSSFQFLHSISGQKPKSVTKRHQNILHQESKPNKEIHAHLRMVEPIKIYTISEDPKSSREINRLQSADISNPKQYALSSNYLTSNSKQTRMNQQTPVSKNEVNNSFNNTCPELNTNGSNSQQVNKSSTNIIRINSANHNGTDLQINKPYFFSRKNSKQLFSQDAQQHKIQWQKQAASLPAASEQIIRKPSIMKLPPPFVRYQPSRRQVVKSSTDISPLIKIDTELKKVENTQQPGIGTGRQMNKQMIIQLYSGQGKSNSAAQSQENDQNTKGFVQMRQKIIDSSCKKAASVNLNEQKDENQVKKNPSSVTERLFVEKPVEKVVNNYQPQPQPLLNKQQTTQNFSNKANSQKSFNEVCNDINQILQNLKMTLKKNQSLVSLNSDFTTKTEGQQMWQRHKLKSSHDPQYIVRQTAIPKPTQKTNQAPKASTYIINQKLTKPEPQTSKINAPYPQMQPGVPKVTNNNTSIHLGIPSGQQSLSNKSPTSQISVSVNKNPQRKIGIENAYKFKTGPGYVSASVEKPGSTGLSKINQLRNVQTAVLNPNGNNVNNIRYDSMDRDKHSFSFNVPNAVLDKYILQDKNRANMNYNHIKSTTTIGQPTSHIPVQQQLTQLSQTPKQYLNPQQNIPQQWVDSNNNLKQPITPNSIISNSSTTAKNQIGNQQPLQSNGVTKLNIVSGREQKNGNTNSQRVRQLVKNISLNNMSRVQQQGWNISSRLPQRQQNIKLEMNSRGGSHTPIYLGNQANISKIGNMGINTGTGPNTSTSTNGYGNIPYLPTRPSHAYKPIQNKIKN